MKLNIEPQVIIHGWLGGLASSIATMRGPMTVLATHLSFSSYPVSYWTTVPKLIEISEGLSTEMCSEGTQIFSL